MKRLKSKYYLVLFAASFLVNCGSKDDKGDNTAGTQDPMQLSPAEQLTADWNGIYRSISNNVPSSEPLEATARFTADRQFEITLQQDQTARVVGTWSEFQGKNLILKITGSTISPIGATGKIVEANFDLLGENLRIYSPTFDLRLTKESSSKPSDSAGTANHFFQANWSCNDGAGRTTRVFIDEKWHFKLSTIRTGERAFVAEGDLSSVSEDLAQLKIQSSSDPLAQGSLFEFRRNTNNTTLILTRPESPSLNLGTCRK
jgi:hypothetical protein